jgi:alkylation response protein AidB-like acyl-CoA dehydrogenase
VLVVAWVQQACLKFYKISYPLINGGESLHFSIYQTIHQTKGIKKMSYKAPLRDIQFVMNEVLDFPNHYESFSEGQNATPDLVDAILGEAAKFSEQVLAPLNAVGDREGCQFNDGQITTPPGFKEAYEKYVEGGWPSLAFPEAYGGQALPASLGQVVSEIPAGENHAFCMYTGLTIGAIATITAHASDDLKQRFIPSMVAGQWSGTMCLTEAHAGSDLGLLRTKAEPNADGTYSISGSKIFISSGDHDLTDNIVHIVLARLSDAPKGVKGISIFVVPKFKVDAQRNVGDFNNVSCGSIEEKMGIHGNATCVTNFDGAQGYLISPPNKGLACMFTFINESRLGVAISAQGHIDASFQKALSYAKDRLQMRAPKRKFPDKAADPIISHPDVRRMLLTQKAFAEGGRVLNYRCAQLLDIANGNGCDEEKQNANALLAVLTPIAKGFLSEASLEATSHGVQILGGHGFIKESGLEQEYRDTRFTAIYEGTTGIQGLDLLGRKILGSGGKILAPYIEEIRSFCANNTGSAYVAQTEASLNQWLGLTKIIGTAASENPDEVNAAGVDYLMFAGYTALAYCWAKIAKAAQVAIDSGSSDAGFYQAKLHTARFYFERIWPRTQTLAITIQSGASNLMEIDEQYFNS